MFVSGGLSWSFIFLVGRRGLLLREFGLLLQVKNVWIGCVCICLLCRCCFCFFCLVCLLVVVVSCVVPM